MSQHDQEIMLLRRELELLMNERQGLLCAVGAAAALIAGLEAQKLPLSTIQSADLLSQAINALSEETLKDALDSVQAHPDHNTRTVNVI